jgi:hypothetical protein
MAKECDHVFCQVEREAFRCSMCGMMADMQADRSLVARGQIKSVNVSLTIGGVKAPDAKRVGDLVTAEFAKHVPIAYETKQNRTRCENCAAPIFWHGATWWAGYGDKQEDCICHATPEQKAHPLMLKDVVENPKLLAPKPCDHRAGVVMSNGEARCAGCHLLVGTVIKNQERLYEQGAEMLRHAGQYPEKVLAELLSADPLTAALSAQVARHLVTPRDPFPLPPPEYGVNMSPFIKTPGFGEAVRHAIEMIKPATLSLDEIMLSAGYVPKDKTVPHADFEAMKVKAYERGDELQTIKDEIRTIKAENSDLRRKVERLERRK